MRSCAWLQICLVSLIATATSPANAHQAHDRLSADV
jgi:hypothetical protein